MTETTSINFAGVMRVSIAAYIKIILRKGHMSKERSLDIKTLRCNPDSLHPPVRIIERKKCYRNDNQYQCRLNCVYAGSLRELLILIPKFRNLKECVHTISL